MLDANMTLFEFHLSNKDVKSNALVLNGCVANLNTKSDAQIYSELEELNCVSLNSNDYEKYLRIEFCFCDNYHDMYQKFWARCFTIRTDNGVRLKINGKKFMGYTVTKVNKQGEMVLSIGIYLDESIYSALLEANMILVEGFIALKNKYNIYGIATQLMREENGFKVLFANTYKLSKLENIEKFCH